MPRPCLHCLGYSVRGGYGELSVFVEGFDGCWVGWSSCCVGGLPAGLVGWGCGICFMVTGHDLSVCCRASFSFFWGVTG